MQILVTEAKGLLMIELDRVRVCGHVTIVHPRGVLVMCGGITRKAEKRTVGGDFRLIFWISRILSSHFI